MADIVRAEGQRAALLARMNAFFDEYDLLLCPATIVAAFPVGERYLAECSGHRFHNYVEWLAIVYAITLTTAPALSLPCGFTKDGRPVGLQVVARPRADRRVLAGAKALEDVLGVKGTTPIDPRPRAGRGLTLFDRAGGQPGDDLALRADGQVQCQLSPRDTSQGSGQFA